MFYGIHIQLKLRNNQIRFTQINIIHFNVESSCDFYDMNNYNIQLMYFTKVA